MHNEYYASGFIYHPASQQILLHQHQPSEEPALWHLFGDVNQPEENPLRTFHRVLTEKLELPIKESHCHFVYDYIHKEKNIPVFMHYAVLEEIPEDDFWGDDITVGWFLFKQIAKLPTAKQTKQDIIVGQRVINMALRQLEVTA